MKQHYSSIQRSIALFARCNDPQQLVWQWPLQRDRIANRSGKPRVPSPW
jgi:hypothetical protein